MDVVNAVMRAVMGAVMIPLGVLPPLAALLVVSAVLGVLAAVVFRYTSNQRALRAIADHTRANMLALRLYKDDTLVTFKAIGGLFGNSLLRLFHSLVPLVILSIPFIPILGQLGMYYQFAPLTPGGETLVEVQLRPQAAQALDALTLVAPEGIDVRVRHRDRKEHRLTYGLVARAPTGPAELIWRLPDGDSVTKRIVVASRADSHRLSYVCPVRGGGFGDKLLYPGEPGFAADAPVDRIAILGYPTRSTPVFGFDVHWLITFVIVSIGGALLAKPFLKVQF